MRVPIRQLVGYIGVGGSKLAATTQRSLICVIAGQHSHEVLAVYVEGSTSGSSGWRELAQAIAHASQTGALLVVARPGLPTHRRVHLWEKLAEANVPIVLGGCLVPPDEIRAMAAAARAECDWIGFLTRDAMARRKLEGAKFGTPRNLTPEARRKGARRSSMNRSLRSMQATIVSAKIGLDMRSGGSTLAEIADELNRQGHKTRHGRRWTQTQVKRVLDRINTFKCMLDQNRAKLDMLCGRMNQQMGGPPMGGM
jgi:Recombinase